MQTQTHEKFLSSTQAQGKQILSFARALLEKCDIQLSKEAFTEVLTLARTNKLIGLEVDALSGLLRVSTELEDFEEISKLRAQIEALIKIAPLEALAGAHYCLGVALSYSSQLKLAYHSYIKAIRASRKVLDQTGYRNFESPAEFVKAGHHALLADYLKYWVGAVNKFIELGHSARAGYMTDALLARFGQLELKGVNGALYMIKGRLSEHSGASTQAMTWYQKAQAAYMKDRNWQSSIYVYYAYARIHRRLRNFSEAYWYLDLASKAAGNDFKNLKGHLDEERSRLQDDAIDLLVDSRSLVISTREQGELSLGKQYVLLGILEALSEAHNRIEVDADHGLSKSEIIERVWKEKYRPEAHDNKLYYNINRLRKLIEPDVRHPKYLLNWKEGYRLAPGIKVHYIKS